MNDTSAFTRAAVVLGAIWIVSVGCSSTVHSNNDPNGGSTEPDPSTQPDAGEPTEPPMPARFEVRLVANGVTGTQRVNFAIPLPAGMLADAGAIRISAEGEELAAARRALARYPDGSLRSVQVQVDANPAATPTLEVALGVAGRDGLELVPVTATLTGSGNNVGPRVWAVLPAEALTASTFAGRMIPRTAFAGTDLDAWAAICDYQRWDTTAFLAESANREVWLFDRVTAMYRGYAMSGDAGPLRSGYREAAIYFAGMTITNGSATAIAVPGASTDLKYHYAQGMALHYLLTGDDRYREAAEAVSRRVAGMWNPAYDGTDRFWTERHAGFALLAHEWAARVTDDQAAAIEARAETAATAFLAVQAAIRFGYTDPDARCFAHSASSHGEGYGNAGCSPWMSAILADALDAHGERVGGQRAADVAASLGKLARILARDGRDTTGRPYYWMKVGAGTSQVDDYEEHWGESAYVVALGWHATGRTDAGLRQAAGELVAGLRTRGRVGRIRSFNWQCRSGVMTPALLQ